MYVVVRTLKTIKGLWTNMLERLPSRNLLSNYMGYLKTFLILDIKKFHTQMMTIKF